MEFEKDIQVDASGQFASSRTEMVIIQSVQDALDMLGNAGQYSCSRFLLRKTNLSDDFYDLKSGLAGEILQKFSNYQVRMALVGDFNSGLSERFKEFVYECNHGRQLLFTDEDAKAISWLKSF